MTPCTATTAENPKKRLGTRQVWWGNGLTDHFFLAGNRIDLYIFACGKIGENAKFRSPVYKNLDIFETVHFMIRICVDEAHYEEWFKKMRFQWADSLIFCGRKANICVILLKGAR